MEMKEKNDVKLNVMIWQEIVRNNEIKVNVSYYY